MAAFSGGRSKHSKREDKLMNELDDEPRAKSSGCPMPESSSMGVAPGWLDLGVVSRLSKASTDSSMPHEASSTSMSEMRSATVKWVKAVIATENRDNWSQIRKTAAWMVESVAFELMMGGIILVNIGVLAEEANAAAFCVSEETDTRMCNSPILSLLNYALLVIYLVESTVKLAIYRSHFFTDGWHVFDAALVIFSVVAEALGNFFPSMTLFRLLRVLRTAKLLHIMVSFRSLYLLVHGFISAMKSIFFASALLGFLLALWSIIAVIMLHPPTVRLHTRSDVFFGCERCPRAFSSVPHAVLTLFQTVVIGDAWGEVAVPLIEAEPWTASIFSLIIATVLLGMCNLIVAVIVDSAVTARERDETYQLETLKWMEGSARKALLEQCALIDKDGDGHLSLEELQWAYDNIEGFAGQCARVRVARDDLTPLYKLMDEDGDGAINYIEFVDHIVRMQSMDAKTLLMFIKQDIHEMRKRLQGVEKMETAINDTQSILAKQGENAAEATVTAIRSAHEELFKALDRLAVSDPTVADNGRAVARGLRQVLEGSVVPLECCSLVGTGEGSCGEVVPDGNERAVTFATAPDKDALPKYMSKYSIPARLSDVAVAMNGDDPEDTAEVLNGLLEEVHSFQRQCRDILPNQGRQPMNMNGHHESEDCNGVQLYRHESLQKLAELTGEVDSGSASSGDDGTDRSANGGHFIDDDRGACRGRDDHTCHATPVGKRLEANDDLRPSDGRRGAHTR
eukprot:TRINITY_DN123808_c0_g1_i1.p1 TRINITY_DN123808_c0_g1~~TRINITY_DN123808_c0_g1_i1.p1  ORF type:complete len:739 (+),score=155.68 TRINITY_DN123808_c0_g1_i1:126-2342(+)